MRSRGITATSGGAVLVVSLLLVGAAHGTTTPNSGAVAPQPSISGRVVGVTDGDSLSVVLDGRATPVRIEGIDAPELRQPYGRAAKSHLASLVFGRDVAVELRGIDRYGRTLAGVTVDGRDVGRAMLEAGLAWQYESRAAVDVPYRAAELTARRLGVGLWSNPEPVPPWVFRRPQEGGSDQSRPRTAPVTGPFHGNVRSFVYHAPGCRDYNCKNCTRIFATRVEAACATPS